MYIRLLRSDYAPGGKVILGFFESSCETNRGRIYDKGIFQVSWFHVDFVLTYERI